MLQVLILSTVLNITSLFFLGWAFADIEKNEGLDTDIELDRNDRWHKTKALALGFFFVNISVLLFGITFATALYVITELSLVVLVFNPTINAFKHNGFFYLSSDPTTFEHHFADKLWKRMLYYFGALIIYLGLTYLLIKNFIS